MAIAPPIAASSRLSVAGRFRFAVRLAAMAAVLAVCVAGFYLWQLAGRHNPWPRRFLGAIAWIAGVDVRVIGQRAAGRSVFLANHVSWLDVPALAGVSGTAFVAHDGLAGFPVLKWLCEMNDTVFIARHDRASIAGQVEQVREAIVRCHALTVFPEGTTSDGTATLPFKSSLLSALDPPPPGVAIQPVLLEYEEAAEIAWVGEEYGLDNFRRILARSQPLRLTVRFLPPLSGAALVDRKTMAAAARAALSGALHPAR